MTDSSNNLIQFQIGKIETLQFAILNEKVNPEGLKIQAGFQFGVDAESYLVQSIFEYTLLSEEEAALKIEVAVVFAISEVCFKREIEKDGTWVIPVSFARHMAMSTVGVARGILHEKTKDSPLNIFPLATIDVTSAVEGDVVLEK